MDSRYDVIILGAGSGGERLGHLLAGAGQRVVAVEEQRVGGECPYVACMPSKAMLRGAHLRADLIEHGQRVGAVGSVPMAENDDDRDDSGAARSPGRNCQGLSGLDRLL